MTTVTTLGAIFMTPLLCKLLLGTLVPVDATGVAVSTIQVLRQRCGRDAAEMQPRCSRGAAEIVAACLESLVAPRPLATPLRAPLLQAGSGEECRG